MNSKNLAVKDEHKAHIQSLDDVYFQKLEKNIERYDYFQVIRFLKRYAQNRGWDVSNITIHPPLFHAKQDDKSVLSVMKNNRSFEVNTNVLALYGPKGVMPPVLTFKLIELENDANFSVRDFLDLFQKNLHDLYFGYLSTQHYGAWRLEMEKDHQSYTNMLLQSARIPKKTIQSRIGDITDFVRYHRLFMRKSKNAKGLQKIIKDYFNRWSMPLDVFIEGYLPNAIKIPENARSMLGQQESMLGNLKVGNIFFGSQGGIQINIRFESLQKYYEFLHQELINVLVDVVHVYLGVVYPVLFDLEVSIDPKSDALYRDPRTQLGVDTWLWLDEEEHKSPTSWRRNYLSLSQSSIMRSVIIEDDDAKEEARKTTFEQAKSASQHKLDLFQSQKETSEHMYKMRAIYGKEYAQAFEEEKLRNEEIRKMLTVSHEDILANNALVDFIWERVPLDQKAAPQLDSGKFFYRIFVGAQKRIQEERDGKIDSMVYQDINDPMLDELQKSVDALIERVSILNALNESRAPSIRVASEPNAISQSVTKDIPAISDEMLRKSSMDSVHVFLQASTQSVDSLDASSVHTSLASTQNSHVIDTDAFQTTTDSFVSIQMKDFEEDALEDLSLQEHETKDEAKNEAYPKQEDPASESLLDEVSEVAQTKRAGENEAHSDDAYAENEALPEISEQTQTFEAKEETQQASRSGRAVVAKTAPQDVIHDDWRSGISAKDDEAEASASSISISAKD